MKTFVIGIDCAVDPNKVGLALASMDGGQCVLLEAVKCSKQSPPKNTVLEWIQELDSPILLALDAPLGWPEALSAELALHSAGNAISQKADKMFRRSTDSFVKNQIGKQPLDIGADRIARTAHATLNLLQEIRQSTREDICLAWNSEFDARIAAIEVYPAATLVSYNLPSMKYKKVEEESTRQEIILNLRQYIDIGQFENILRKDADVLDSVVCVLAAGNFLTSKAMSPPNLELAKKEGWIWVSELKKPGELKGVRNLFSSDNSRHIHRNHAE